MAVKWNVKKFNPTILEFFVVSLTSHILKNVTYFYHDDYVNKKFTYYNFYSN